MHLLNRYEVPPLFPTLRTTVLGVLTLTAIMTTTASAAAEDHRSRVVESSLKDLSARNDAAIARGQIRHEASADPLGNPRVKLTSEPLPASDVLIGAEVQSSLHRLRRETVSIQTPDGRKARVNENLDRVATDP